MTRMQSEVNRLYLPAPAADATGFFDAQGRVRALVIEVVQPVGWEALSRAWQGAQSELGLPAPAIAVSGTDGLQLWFSLESPLAVDDAHAFLEALRARFLADVAAACVRLLPDPASPGRHAARVPALIEATGNWSAFVAPDLAAVFSDTPWLDIEPGADGQATLLHGLRSIAPTGLADAIARLRADATDARDKRDGAAVAPAAGRASEPAAFLLRIMNDEAVDLALRIEAAKALLPFMGG